MKIGILGGGQLGKMLYAPANKLDVDIRFMDSMTEGPVSKIAINYTVGDITDYDDVMAFGSECDILSIEIEKVNCKALKELEKSGVTVYPQPDILELIQDKGLQKDFYKRQGLPTSDFNFFDTISDLEDAIVKGEVKYPFVQKLRKDGYDGRGVQIIRKETDLSQAFKSNFITEDLVTIHKEIGVITCRDANGQVVVYDPVEMVFHADANILLYQLSPADISDKVINQAKDLAIKTTEAYDIVGLLAIEMFLTQSGELMINEVAPRPHNSGHHSIEATMCSQYENQLRTLSNLPLGDTTTITTSLLMNVLGAEGYTGPVFYEGIEKVLAIPGVNLHLYGKTTTKPFRKMGHINIVGESPEELVAHYHYITDNFRVISN